MIDVGKLSPLWVALHPRQVALGCLWDLLLGSQRVSQHAPLLLLHIFAWVSTLSLPHDGPWPGCISQINHFLSSEHFITGQKAKKKKKVSNENNVSIVLGTKYRIVQRVRRHLPPLSYFPLTYFPSPSGCAFSLLAPDILERLLLVSQRPRFIFVLGSLEQVIPFLSLQLSAHTVRVLILLLNHPLTWLTLPPSALSMDITYFRKPSSCWGPLLPFLCSIFMGFVSSP